MAAHEDLTEEEVRSSSYYFSKIPKADVDRKQLALVGELIRTFSGPLRLDAFRDDYEAALRKLLEAKRKNKPLPLEEEGPRRAKVIDLMDALRQSVTSTRRRPAKREREVESVPRKGPILVKPSKVKSNKRKRRAA